jgi:hypothetical protein
MKFKKSLTVLVSVFATGTAFATPGAIYTTDSTCSGVNVNIFTSKDDVYLNGGPPRGRIGPPRWKLLCAGNDA